MPFTSYSKWSPTRSGGGLITCLQSCHNVSSLNGFGSETWNVECTLILGGNSNLNTYLNTRSTIGNRPANLDMNFKVRFFVVHLFIRRAQNTMGTRGTPKWHPGLVAPLVIGPKVILVWVRTLDVGNASHPRRLGVMKIRPLALRSLWCGDSKVLKNTSIGGELGVIAIRVGRYRGQRLGTTMAWEWLPRLPRFEYA